MLAVWLMGAWVAAAQYGESSGLPEDPPAEPAAKEPAATTTNLAAIPAIESGKVSVSIENGRARLTGTVRTLLTRTQIESAVRGMDGVFYVENDIRIERDPKYRRDLDIETEIKQSLVSNPVTQSFDVSIKVQKGRARLWGTVESREEMETVLRLAMSVPGLLAIDNDLVVED